MTAVALLAAPSFPTDSEIVATLKLAEALVKSGMMPKAIDTPAKAVALMLTGREMGMGPMQALRSIGIVDGKPVVAADLQLGLFKRAGGRAEFLRLDTTGAELHLTHPNGDEHTETFTKDDATLAGLLGKANWKQWPKAMYRSRAITAGLKSLGFEPLAGVYDPDADEITTLDPPPPEPPKKGMSALKAKVVTEPPAETKPDAPEPSATVESAPGGWLTADQPELPPVGTSEALETLRAELIALLDDAGTPARCRVAYLVPVQNENDLASLRAMEAAILAARKREGGQ